VVLDCEDPRRLAGFYSVLLGQPVTFDDGGWVVVSADTTTSGLAFQRVERHVTPAWPDPDRPQQVHLDVMVDDLDQADAEVRALGATRLEGGDHVYADPAGHPFCLVPRPRWAAPVARE